jgi:UPF0716 protein FxsA
MWIILGIVAILLIEIALFVTLGGAIGLWLTLAWVLLTAVIGFMLLKGVAMMGAHQLTAGVRQNMRDPSSPLAHRVLVGVAGLLLLLPGFLTDALGLLLLLPPVRRVLIRFVAARVTAASVAARTDVFEGQWRDVTSDTAPGPRPSQDNSPPEFTRH